jgi:photosystem II stability/assembly factor-like uncharacterized protein
MRFQIRSLRRALPIGLLLIGAAPLSALPVVAGSWSLLGPDGGSVFDLVSESDKLQVLYAGVDAGVFRSMNGGATWSWAGNGLDLRVPVNTLAVDPIHPSTLYAGQLTGLYKSTNRGASWTKTSLGSNLVYKIAVHPRFSGTVFAATSVGLFQSNNGGGRWKLLTKGLIQPFYFASWVSIDPASPRRMFTSVQDGGLNHGGLYQSLDGGASWQPIHSGVMDNQTVRALAIDRHSPRTLYAGALFGAFKSTDGGKTWINLSFPDFNVVLSLVLHPTQPNVVYAGAGGGLFLSQDGGGTWTALTQGLPLFGSVAGLLISTSHPQTLYAGVAGVDTIHSSGVFHTGDGGGSWTLASRGLSASNVTSVAVAAQNPDTLWSISDFIPFRSVDRGETWTAVEPGPLLSNHRLPPRVVIDPLDAAAVYIQTDDGQILRSSDGGQTWETAGSSGPPLALAISPQHPAVLWAASQQGAGGLLRSLDRGDTWTVMSGPASAGFYLAFDIPPSAPSTVYAAGTLDFKARFVRTTDGGATWTFIQDGLPTAVAVVAADPLAPSTVWTVSGGEVYKSTDSGDHWAPVSSAFHNRIVKSLAASTSGSLYAAVDQDNVYESTDGGQTWTPFTAGPSLYTLNTLTLDPKDPCRIYVATFNRGLLAFTKSGTADCP